MKIIAGKFKGKNIDSLPIPNLRPTLGRVKETFFAIIENYVDPNGIRVLDVFAGTGNLGLEALSRGAEKVLFVEHNKDSLSIIRKNVRSFFVEKNADIMTLDAVKAVNRLIKEKRKFDLIIMDPPFRQDYLNRIIAETEIEKILEDDGLLTCETEKIICLKIMKNGILLKKGKSLTADYIF